MLKCGPRLGRCDGARPDRQQTWRTTIRRGRTESAYQKAPVKGRSGAQIRTRPESDLVTALCGPKVLVAQPPAWPKGCAVPTHPRIHWYPRPDSNRHARRRGILNPLRLPFRHLGTGRTCSRPHLSRQGRFAALATKLDDAAAQMGTAFCRAIRQIPRPQLLRPSNAGAFPPDLLTGRRQRTSRCTLTVQETFQ